jgi:hypothetical protein
VKEERARFIVGQSWGRSAAVRRRVGTFFRVLFLEREKKKDAFSLEKKARVRARRTSN